MIPRKILDKEELNALYNMHRLSLKKVSIVMGCSIGPIINNLKYFGFEIRNKCESMIGRKSWNKGLTKETNSSLMSLSLKYSGHPTGRKPPNTGLISNDKILVKIIKKQSSITTDFNLESFGYRKTHVRKNGAIEWELREYANKKMREKRKQNPEKYNAYSRMHYQDNKEAYQNRHRLYNKTEKGKLNSKKKLYKHLQKGFIPLNKPLNIPFDWHHLTKELPFVMATDRAIHKSYYGKKHYDSVNKEIGLIELVGKSKEDIEYYIELNYPEEFKQYWFGNY